MGTESNYIELGGERLHYLKWGSGKRLLLAFHGYGDDANIFLPIRQYLEDDYTVLSVDLPHHGGSNWQTDELFDRHGLITMVNELMHTYHVSKVSLMGYSMGGRVCLSVIEQQPQCIDRVALIATDGLTVNFYYYFFTKTAVGRKMFNHMLERPGKYLGVIEWLKKKNLVDGSRYKFVMHFLGSEENRSFLQKVWPNTSDLMPAPDRVKKMIRKYRIQVAVFMGAHDKIIPLAHAHRFKKGLDTVRVFVLDKGHRLFDDTNAHLVAEQLLLTE